MTVGHSPGPAVSYEATSSPGVASFFACGNAFTPAEPPSRLRHCFHACGSLEISRSSNGLSFRNT
jgi:hypothetical protein